MTDEMMKYDVPIRSPEHAAFLRGEAERRYGGKIVRDGEMLIVVDEDGNATGTDAVLRALSFYAAPIIEKPEDPIETIMQAVLDEGDWYDVLSEAISNAIDTIDADIVADFVKRLEAAGIDLDKPLMDRFRTFVDDNHADGNGLMSLFVKRHPA